MGKEFKKGDKVFHTRLKKYGIFVAYSKLSDDDAIVEFIDYYGDKDVKVFSSCFLQKVEIKEVETKEDKVHYEVFYKVYIDNSKTLERVKKEMFNKENEAIKYLKRRRNDYGVNWIEGNVIEVKSKEIFTL